MLRFRESFGSAVAQIAEVTVKGDEVVVDRVVCVVDCGIAVTPDVGRAQMESAIGYGLGAALHSTITMTDGHVDQTNFHQYQVLRINEMPKVVEVHIVPSKEAPTGVGELGTPPIGTGGGERDSHGARGIKLRKLPFDLAGCARGEVRSAALPPPRARARAAPRLHSDENYLRGVQVTDANGQCRSDHLSGLLFGRYPHIHFEVYSSLGWRRSTRTAC